MPKQGSTIKKDKKAKASTLTKDSVKRRIKSSAKSKGKSLPKKNSSGQGTKKAAALDAAEAPEQEGDEEMEKSLEEMDMDVTAQEGDLDFLLTESSFGDEQEKEGDEDDDEEPVPPIEESRPLHRLMEDEISDLELDEGIDLEEEKELEEEDEEAEPSIDELDQEFLKNEEVISASKKAEQEGWNCPGCFIKVMPSQFGSPENPSCPSSEPICPGIKKFF